MEPGGQLTTTTEVDNFPGYPKGIDGPQMMMELKEQAERFGTDVRIGEVIKVNFKDNKDEYHEVIVNNETIIQAKTIIISTGASAKYLGIESEQRLIGGGVSACAVCDGFFYKGQEVAIVGGGDTAAEEATYLSNICSKVTMLVRRDVMRASKAMQHRVNSKENIVVKYNTEVVDVIMKNVVEGLKMINNKTNKTENIDITGFFVAIGHKPNTDIFKGQLDMDDTGYIITNGKSTKTNKPGVFASEMFKIKNIDKQLLLLGLVVCALDAERYLASIGF